MKWNLELTLTVTILRNNIMHAKAASSDAVWFITGFQFFLFFFYLLVLSSLLVIFGTNELFMGHPQRPKSSLLVWAKMRNESFKYGQKSSPWVLTLTHFQKIMRMLTPDWEQNILFVHQGYCLTILVPFIFQSWTCKREKSYFLLS